MSPSDNASAEQVGNARQATGAGVYFAFVVLVAATTFFLHMRFDGIFACPPAPAGEDYYLGYCNSTAYGDYDHGSFWFDLEEAASDDARSADVLFLGNSRLQFGFSSRALTQWFSRNQAHYYLLGFSHFENASFTRPLLARLQPRARAYVINLDDFFSARPTEIGRFVMDDRAARRRYEAKRTWQSIQQRVCRTAPFLCGGTDAFAYYRRRAGGDWRLGGSNALLAPSGVGPPTAADVARVDEQVRSAAAVLAALPASRECIVLTYVPASQNDLATASAIASRLGYSFVSPHLDGLRTFDGSHLDIQSAERFSEAFFREAGPQLQRCLDTAGANAERDG